MLSGNNLSDLTAATSAGLAVGSLNFISTRALKYSLAALQASLPISLKKPPPISAKAAPEIC
jgi:hypothetical protein